MRERNVERSERTLARICNDLDAGSEAAPWLDAARSLRDRLVISENTYLFLADLFIDPLMVTFGETDAELQRGAAAMRVIETEHRLRPDEYWSPDDGPPEWQEHDVAWRQRANMLLVAALRERHHDEVADLLEQDPAAFETRAARGRIELWGEDEEPEWTDPPSSVYPPFAG